MLEPQYGVVADGEGRAVVRIVSYGGLGDNLMISAGMGACYERHGGNVRFDVFTHSGGWHAVWRHQPFIRSINIRPLVPLHPDSEDEWKRRLMFPAPTENAIGLKTPKPVDDPDCGQTVHPFRVLAVDDEPHEKRRMRYVVTQAERQEAFALLTEAGWRGETLIGLQLHGGQPIKQWRHLTSFASLARMYGCFVVTTGEKQRNGKYGFFAPTGLGSLVGKLPTARHLGAVQTWLDAWVGFDSGGSFMACAVDCPAVFLCGPIDASVMMNALGGHIRWRSLREDCAIGCSAEGSFRCERGTQEGCPCIDAISPHRVWEEVLELINKPGREPMDVGQAIGAA